MTTVGTAPLLFRPDPDWPRVPAEIALNEAVGVATDSSARAFVFHRGEPPVLIFEADGTFVRGWGDGQFVRPHGIWIAPDDTLYLVDDRGHSVRQYSRDGELLRRIGPEGKPSQTGIKNGDLRTITHGGPPYNLPTNLVTSSTGELYVTDGYGNCRVHRFSADGELIRSLGAPGQREGEFFLPHGIGIDADDRLYVADRENSRIQVFSPDGEFLDQWTDVVRPCEAFIADGLVYVAEVGMRVGMFPWMTRDLSQSGGRVSVFDRQGKLLARWGGGDNPDSPADFYAPHDIWVDRRGDVYVAEVKVAAAVSVGDDTSRLPTLRKFVRQ